MHIGPLAAADRQTTTMNMSSTRWESCLHKTDRTELNKKNSNSNSQNYKMALRYTLLVLAACFVAVSQVCPTN